MQYNYGSLRSDLSSVLTVIPKGLQLRSQPLTHDWLTHSPSHSRVLVLNPVFSEATEPLTLLLGAAFVLA